MQYIADLQIHSKYARAVSPEMVIPKIWEWAMRKGIHIIATGDWTHPLWLKEIKTNLEELGNGLLKFKHNPEKGLVEGRVDPYFLLATEVSSIYKQSGKLRRIHTLIWAPSIIAVEKINHELQVRGANLSADGRPIVGFSSEILCDIVLTVDPRCLIIPAHSWTPWFSLFGSQSGFDSVNECFGKFAKYIYAIETGLSSDPAMNWRIRELDTRSIVSFSDAHSGPKIGREATVFELSTPSFSSIAKAISAPSRRSHAKDEKKNKTNGEHSSICYTIEFYPEEGKYHFNGHRNCKIVQSPQETRENGSKCPVCGNILTIGVMHRVQDLACRSLKELKLAKKNIPETLIEGTYSQTYQDRPPYSMLVPLQEIISEHYGMASTALTVKNEYMKLTDMLGTEFTILLKSRLTDIARISGEKIAQAIGKVRNGDISIEPGYDGKFGKVTIWSKEKEQNKTIKQQLSFFS